MIRWILIAVLALTCCSLSGCAKTYMYNYYEVIRAADELRVGDDLRVALKNDERVRGTLIRVNETEVVVATEGRGKKRIAWEDIHLLERIVRKKETSY